MAQYTNQHYVPQSYLQRFTHDGKTIYVYDKFTNNSFGTNIRNVASERNFYDFPKDASTQAGVDPQMIEKALSQIEGDFEKTVHTLLKTLEQGKRNIIGREQRITMSYFIANQFLRTREFRESLVESIEKLNEAFLTRVSDYEPSKFKIEANKDHVSLLQFGLMFNPKTLDRLAHELNNHIWFIGINKTPKPFYTSDHPVVKRGHIQHPLKSYEGLASRGIEIAFPLSSQYILILCERTAFRQNKKFNNKSISCNADNVSYYNSLQIHQSYRQIYSESDDFDLAKEIWRTHPNLSKPKQDRYQIN